MKDFILHKRRALSKDKCEHLQMHANKQIKFHTGDIMKKVDEAKAFVDWILSVDAQKFMMSEGKIPLHPDASPPEGYPNVNEIKLLSFDAAEALKNNDAIRSKFADLFGL